MMPKWIGPRSIGLALAGASLLVLSACAPGYGTYGHAGPGANAYGHPATHNVPRYANFHDALRGRKTLPHQVNAPPGFFRAWNEGESAYTLYPGDQLDIVVASAPELSRTLTIGPDGRIVMPMSAPIMAAGKTFAQAEMELRQQLARSLRDPSVAVTPRAYAPEQVYVGGEVGQPGTYTLPGPIGAIETIFMAGGVRPTARAREIAILRRARDGGMMMRTVNLRNGLNNIREYNDNIQLRRGDIIFVPRNTLAEIGVFSQNLRSTYPFDFNLTYQFGNDFDGATTVISP